MNKRCKITGQVIMLLCMFMMVFSCSAAAKNIKVKARTYTHVAGIVEEAATSVKCGESKLRVGSKRLPSGFACFRAPADGKYSFVISDMKPVGAKKGADYKAIGHATILRKNYNDFLVERVISVKGGRVSSLNLATAKAYESMKQSGKSEKNKYLCKRTARINLFKGDTIYIFFTFSKRMDLLLQVRKM